MSTSRVYTLPSRRSSLKKNSLKFYDDSKMEGKKSCEVSRVRVCKPLKECYDKVTETRMEQVPCDPCDPCDSHVQHHHHGHGYGAIGWAVLWFLIIAVIVWLILFSLRPAWAVDEDGNVDTGKVLLASIVIALIIVIIVWIIWCACAGSWY
jgi:hypothetical protein